MTTKTQLLDHIKSNPGETTNEIAERFGVAIFTAHGLLTDLAKESLIYETKGPGRKVWKEHVFGGYSPKGAA